MARSGDAAAFLGIDQPLQIALHEFAILIADAGRFEQLLESGGEAGVGIVGPLVLSLYLSRRLMFARGISLRHGS